MPTVNVTVTTLGFYTAGSDVGSNPVSADDGDATYRQVQSGAVTYGCTDVSGIGPITKVTGRVTARKTGGSGYDMRVRVRENSLDSDGGDAGITTSYAQYSADFPLAPDGTNWTIAKVNAMELGLVMTAGAGTERLRVTLINGVVTYSLTGGFVLLIGGILGPVFGAGVLLREMASAARLVAQRTGLLLDSDEVAAAWRELRDSKGWACTR